MIRLKHFQKCENGNSSLPRTANKNFGNNAQQVRLFARPVRCRKFLSIVFLYSGLQPYLGVVKRGIAITLIVLLSSQCIFKLGIITFFNLNRDFIAEVLCVNKEKPITICYGQCFLDRNLSLVEEETPSQAPPSVKYESTVFIAYSVEISISPRPLSLQNDFEIPGVSYRFDGVHDVFHPPC